MSRSGAARVGALASSCLGQLGKAIFAGFLIALVIPQSSQQAAAQYAPAAPRDQYPDWAWSGYRMGKLPHPRETVAFINYWTGWYLGFNYSYSQAHTGLQFPFEGQGSANFSSNGSMYGFNTGINFAAGPLIVGPILSFDFGHLSSTTTVPNVCATGCEISNSWTGQLGLLVGYPISSNVMPFFTVSGAVGDVKTRIGTLDQTTTGTGYGLGGGVAIRVPQFWGQPQISVQYNRVQLDHSCKFPVCDGLASGSASYDRVTAGWSFHLWDAGPSVGYERYQSVAPSDARLKTDIVALGHLDNGLAIYRFQYVGSDEVYVGVIAQEVAMLRPDAVTREDGYLFVDYDRLGLRMQTWEEWSTSNQIDDLIAAH